MIEGLFESDAEAGQRSDRQTGLEQGLQDDGKRVDRPSVGSLAGLRVGPRSGLGRRCDNRPTIFNYVITLTAPRSLFVKRG
jgi:hypothetical protein